MSKLEELPDLQDDQAARHFATLTRRPSALGVSHPRELHEAPKSADPADILYAKRA